MLKFNRHNNLTLSLFLSTVLWTPFTALAQNRMRDPAGVSTAESCPKNKNNPQNMQDVLANVPATQWSEAQLADLRSQWEEDKLARDIYTLASETWGLRVFQKISAAESRHMSLLKTLLDRYGQELPSAVNAPGSYADPELQKLYDDFAPRVVRSRTDALQVAIAIEELDIESLDGLISRAADDGVLVYTHLQEGSRRHLQAFQRNLDRGPGNGRGYGRRGRGGMGSRPGPFGTPGNDIR